MKQLLIESWIILLRSSFLGILLLGGLIALLRIGCARGAACAGAASRDGMREFRAWQSRRAAERRVSIAGKTATHSD